MFNKATSKLPPRIEKWVMDMQNVDYELVYEPGKDAADPLDFLSRHPLPETGTDTAEKIIKQVIVDEHAVVMDRIKEETETDSQLQKLSNVILRGDWEQHKKDPDITPFYMIRYELYTAEGLIFRLNRIIIPRNLHRKVIKAPHKLGHFGMTRTKQMLREKYWFPAMNNLVEQIIGQCYECQVTTQQHKQEPIKMTTIPEKPWDVILVDFGGPYPDGHYNLVAIDKRTRYPEVETVYSTEKAQENVCHTWYTKAARKEFADFAKEEGFHHHLVTPEHAQAHGAAESFMKMLNKTERIAHLQGKDCETAVQEMLTGYRSTPHPATNTTPYEALMKRQRLKRSAENRNTKAYNFVVGDYVLVKQHKKNKWTTAYEPAFYIIYRIDGSSIAGRRITDGRETYRDASKFKLVNAVVQNIDEGQQIPLTHNKELDSEDWREQLLLMTNQEEQEVRQPEQQAESETVCNTPSKLKSEPPVIRPQRNRRRPAYLNDYE
uniref:Uncharacterized protein K02A2.6-like n=1 Tax=Saccoglossus kowalevskii TaxID=10224 RepID=A0ABM0M3U2_SACKO|nr:PREDICTED: uncharacterized protein K02A2.6-like [Saccoglossus kowalevskii]